MKKIAIVEDDRDLRCELDTLLSRNGYEAVQIEKFENVCAEIMSAAPDMVLLDINLPGVDGQSVLKELRKEADIPVIMVTSRDTEMDEVLCMSFGADDFIAKPYNPSILLLHIEAIFKRMAPKGESSEIVYNNVKLDIARSILISDEKSVEVSKNEMKILTYMLNNRGRIISRDELMSYLWDSEEFVDDNTLTVNINRVRRKIEDIGGNLKIVTKRGQGYIVE